MQSIRLIQKLLNCFQTHFINRVHQYENILSFKAYKQTFVSQIQTRQKKYHTQNSAQRWQANTAKLTQLLNLSQFQIKFEITVEFYP